MNAIYWQQIDTAPGYEEGVHMRGLRIRSRSTNTVSFCTYTGYVDCDGNFADEHTGEDVGWLPDDFTHWLPKPNKHTPNSGMFYLACPNTKSDIKNYRARKQSQRLRTDGKR